MKRADFPKLAPLFMLLFCGAALACPNCKNSIPEGGEALAMRMREGYYWSYIFMTSVPFVAVSCIAAMLYRAHRKAADRQISAAKE